MSGVPTICSRLMLVLTSLRPARPITMAPTPKTTRMRPAMIPPRRSERDIEAPGSLISSTVPRSDQSPSAARRTIAADFPLGSHLCERGTGAGKPQSDAEIRRWTADHTELGSTHDPARPPSSCSGAEDHVVGADSSPDRPRDRRAPADRARLHQLMTALRDIPTAALVGVTALAFSALYLVSDVIEALQGGFSGASSG